MHFLAIGFLRKNSQDLFAETTVNEAKNLIFDGLQAS